MVPKGSKIGRPSGVFACDAEGRLTIAEHGNRRISRIEPKGQVTVLADRYEGKRLNSPNDACYKSNGDLYFTDPPYGLPRQMDDKRKELDFQGVYRLSRDGKLTLLQGESPLILPSVDEQQRTNYQRAAEISALIRENEPAGTTVSIGGEIGEVGSVHFEWLLDVRHGADYFRRWHRRTQLHNRRVSRRFN